MERCVRGRRAVWDEYIASRLRGRRVLIVEDDYLLAQDMAEMVEAQGAKILGPVRNVADGLSLLLRERLPDAAILDVRLGQETVFPLVEGLATLGVPFLFATGNPDWSLPERYERVPHCEKPIDERELLQTLAGLSGAPDRPCAKGGRGAAASDSSWMPPDVPPVALAGASIRTLAGSARASGPASGPWSS